MTDEELEKYLTGHRKQIVADEQAVKEIKKQALAKAQQIGWLLAEKYSIQKVYLFGSLVAGNFNLQSDLDLAVEGLADEDYLKAYGLVEEIAAPLKVDLISLESAMPSLRERVLEEGRVLYDVQGEKDSPA